MYKLRRLLKNANVLMGCECLIKEFVEVVVLQAFKQKPRSFPFY